MSCSKHIQRKRPNSCEDCATELRVVKEPVGKTTIPKEKIKAAVKVVVKKREAKSVEKAPKQVLANMEKEVEEMVIKPERAKREKVVADVAPAVEIDEIPEETKSCIDTNKEAIEKYFKDKLSDFKDQVAHQSNMQYEWLDIPADRIGMALMDKLYSDKWHLVNFLTGDCAKVSGFRTDTAVFDRVKGNNKKTVDEWKKEIK